MSFCFYWWKEQNMTDICSHTLLKFQCVKTLQCMFLSTFFVLRKTQQDNTTTTSVNHYSPPIIISEVLLASLLLTAERNKDKRTVFSTVPIGLESSSTEKELKLQASSYWLCHLFSTNSLGLGYGQKIYFNSILKSCKHVFHFALYSTPGHNGNHILITSLYCKLGLFLIWQM